MNSYAFGFEKDSGIPDRSVASISGAGLPAEIWRECRLNSRSASAFVKAYSVHVLGCRVALMCGEPGMVHHFHAVLREAQSLYRIRDIHSPQSAAS
jgi:hypothetical protein